MGLSETVLLIAFVPALLVIVVGLLSRNTVRTGYFALSMAALSLLTGHPLYAALDLGLVAISYYWSYRLIKRWNERTRLHEQLVAKQAMATPSVQHTHSRNPVIKAIIIVVVLSLAWTVYKNESDYSRKPDQQVATLQDKQQAVVKANLDLNRGLPVMIDSQTMLTSVEASVNETIYNIRMINYPSGSLDQNFVSKAQEQIGRQNCANKDVVWSFDQGMHMKYIISGSDKITVGSFILSKVYCQNLKP